MPHTPQYGAMVGSVAAVSAGVATVELDDSSVVEAAFKATGAPAPAVTDPAQRVIMLRSGDTWVIIDTIVAVT